MMRLADDPVPKKSASETGMTTGGGGLHYCSLADAVPRFTEETAGKILFVSDGSSFPALAFAARSPRAISVVLDGPDALPLFSVPETVGAVFAAGREETLVAARFFAGVRGIRCAAAPTDGACFGVFGGRSPVLLDGTRTQAPLAEAEAICDVALMEPTLGDARARLSLARLAALEARALSAFGMPQKEPCAPLSAECTEDVVRANARLRQGEAEGAWRGEGATLALLYAVPDAWRAFCELSALYGAFFGRGTPRKYAVPDYAARAARAGTAYAEARVPAPDEYAHRALVLERRRNDFAREIALILRDKSSESHSVYAFSKKTAAFGGVSEALKTLPEHCPCGLCAVIRDFGLMEQL